MHYGRGHERVDRGGCWSPPALRELKINTNGSFRENPRHAGIGGIGRDCSGVVVFFFSMYKGLHSNNLMEAIVILLVVEWVVGLGW